MKIKVTKRPTTTKEKIIGGAGWIAVIGCIANYKIERYVLNEGTSHIRN